MKTLNLITLVLLVVGGLNWGLVGAANFDLVATLFGAQTVVSKAVYILVGLSALVQVARLVMPSSALKTASSH